MGTARREFRASHSRTCAGACRGLRPCDGDRAINLHDRRDETRGVCGEWTVRIVDFSHRDEPTARRDASPSSPREADGSRPFRQCAKSGWLELQ